MRLAMNMDKMAKGMIQRAVKEEMQSPNKTLCPKV